MRIITRYWRFGLLGVMLFGLGWALFLILPVEPRWRIALENEASWFDFFWEKGTGRVRVLTSQGEDERAFRHDVHGPATIDLTTGKFVRRFGEEIFGFRLKYSQDGHFAAGGSTWLRKLSWIDYESGREDVVDIPGEGKYAWHAFSPSAEWLLVGVREPNERVIWVFDTRSFQPNYKILNSGSAHFLPHGDMVICSLREYPSPLRIWDINKKRVLSELPGATSVSKISRDGSLIAAMDLDQGLASAWNISPPEAPRLIVAASTKLTAISADGLTCAVQTQDRVQVWDARTGKKRFELSDASHFSVNGIIVEMPVLLFSPDSRRVCVASASERILRIHDVTTGDLVCRIATSNRRNIIDDPFHPVFTPDSSKLLTINHSRTAQVWSVETGDLLFEIPEAESDWNGDSRLALVRHKPRKDQSPGWFKKALNYLRPKRDVGELLSVLDLDNLEITATVENRLKPGKSELSPDGTSLLVAGNDADGNSQLICWDVPAARPWRWIAGLPAGLGVVTLILWYARKIRRRRSAPSSAAI